jgi:phage-related minor tail protein
LAKILFQAALSGLAGTDGKGFFSFLTGTLGKRANGGSVNSGSPYIVGERGPELFVPGRSGTIVPNDKMGGGTTNVVVNVDAKGSSVEGNEQGANQLGRVISAAVQSELIKQKRPGGLLAR